MRAFWGVVYRLLDQPTDTALRIIRAWLEHDWKRFWGYPEDPTLKISPERMEERAKFALTLYESTPPDNWATR
jgi:hypothetical protein